MGDRPLGSHSAAGSSDNPQSTRQDEALTPSLGPYEDRDSRTEGHSTSGTLPNYHQSHQYSHHQQHHQQQQQLPQSQMEPFDMNSLTTALLDASYQNYGHQRYHIASPLGPNYQVQNIQQFPGQQGVNQPPNRAYNQLYQGQYPGVYGSNQSSSPPQLQQAAPNLNQYYLNQTYLGHQQQSPQQYFMQNNQYGSQNNVYSGVPSPIHYAQHSSGFPGESRHLSQPRANEYLGTGSGGGDSGRQSSRGSSSTPSSVVRGPPRKPRQSGHAIWIGNLPPQTELMQLVAHVCKEAPGLESLFLISKSNCAFANYKDEATCNDAQAKIHDSKFQTVRLVSRLRRGSVPATPGGTVPTGPAALTPPSNPPVARSPSPDPEPKAKEAAPVEANGIPETRQDSSVPNDKFFIVKSLTVEDLELSVRNGIWATQSHNEETLNKAYQEVDNVYLIFSANKSGEYFGYARMISPLNDDPAAAIEFAPMAQTVEDPELPKAIPTPATEYTPKGRIIDDSAGGTIFWEVERDEEDEEDETDSNKSDGTESPTPAKAWGKPFKIEWISTTRLPFYRTRGLRNPWNSNREVKIARDGTEIETAVGRRLLGLFHRVPSPTTQQQVLMQGVSMPLVGYPPMHQHL